MQEDAKWFESDEIDEEDEFAVTEYDIVSSPNDFNVSTLFNLVESGVVKLPPFQRNFVWDIKRASRLIESLIIGLPIPQLFLYEQERNRFLVIDGQQRLMSIYYFMKLRFPKSSKRSALRRKLIEDSLEHPSSLLSDNEFFSGFRLNLPSDPEFPPNPLDKLDYETLGDLQANFALRTVRCIVVKQVSPAGMDSIYEIFNRLNSGGVNLAAQEIRMAIYHSAFMSMLTRLNFDERWRSLVGKDDADIHLRDVEFLLRGVALLADGESYRPSMTRFLNGFSAKATTYEATYVDFIENLIDGFLDAAEALGPGAFQGPTGRFTVTIFDAVFTGACGPAYEQQSTDVDQIEPDQLAALKADEEFIESSQYRTTGAGNVKTRIRLARHYLAGDN